MKRLTAWKVKAPFINLTHKDIISRIVDTIAKIQSKSGDAKQRVAFTVGVDATCLVQSFQVAPNLGVIVGGAYPNHYIALGDGGHEEMKELLKECVEYKKYGPPAAEAKCAVVAFQGVPQGMTPYFPLAAHPQSINESNSFAKDIMNLCTMAAKEAGDAVRLNISTDGVFCEVQGNLAAVQAYLSGCQDWISRTDPNHDVKNHRYQLIGGSSPASIGYFVFDSFLLKLAGVAKELIYVENFTSDALPPLQLASISTIRQVIEFGAPDIGNTTVTVVYLAFIRLWSYAVNGRKVTWRDCAMYSWATMLWITSFHAPGSRMMANKRNIVLETVGFMFLVTRADVWLHILLPSESNEHTYGGWRQLLREFTMDMEQLIRIVWKHYVKLNAIFKSNLVTARSGSSFSGYAHTFPQFLAALRGGASNDTAGPVTVDLDSDIAAVDQLWERFTV